MSKQDTYNTLKKYKSNLTKGSSDVSTLNTRIGELKEDLKSAVKGDYYGVSSSEFATLKEKSPSEDSKITNAQKYVQNEMDAIKAEIEEEARKKAEEAARKKAEEEARKKAEEEAKKKAQTK